MSSRKRRRDSRSSVQRQRATVRDALDCNPNNISTLSKSINWLLGDSDIFVNEAFHGNIKWSPKQLAFQALVWAFQESRNVTDSFDRALACCEKLAMPETAKTYPRFINALARYKCVASRVRDRIQECAEQVGGRFWRTDSWVLFAFDGSRIGAPRTISNEKAFCASNYGQGKTAKYRKKKSKGMRRKQNERNKPEPPRPQVWMTAVWHMGLRLTWTWRFGPSNSSERGHVEAILKEEEFPEKSLLCGDAGFVGYPIWSSILAGKADFLVRVGANASLLSEHADIRRVNDDVVLCWPKGKMHSGDPPLKLRLVRVKIGKTKMWILTSVLNRKELSIKQIVRYYEMRWGIEVQYRGLKQTLETCQLRCRNSDNALAELEWSVLGMMAVECLALREQMLANKLGKTNYQPSDRSLAKSIRAVRKCMNDPEHIPAPTKGLRHELSVAVVQKYNNRTDKRSRYTPRNPDKKPLGDPTLEKLTAIHRRKLAERFQKLAA